MPVSWWTNGGHATLGAVALGSSGGLRVGSVLRWGGCIAVRDDAVGGPVFANLAIESGSASVGTPVGELLGQPLRAGRCPSALHRAAAISSCRVARCRCRPRQPACPTNVEVVKKLHGGSDEPCVSAGRNRPGRGERWSGLGPDLQRHHPLGGRGARCSRSTTSSLGRAGGAVPLVSVLPRTWPAIRSSLSLATRRERASARRWAMSLPAIWRSAIASSRLIRRGQGNRMDRASQLWPDASLARAAAFAARCGSRPGALGDGLPRRDLLVSPWSCDVPGCWCRRPAW